MPRRALALVVLTGLAGISHGWVTVSPQGRVTIKAETQIGYALHIGSQPVLVSSHTSSACRDAGTGSCPRRSTLESRCS